MKIEKKNLLSIGALAKQTGVHVKSLRYYDRLGILRPAYVDPESGYRYYSLHQIPLVDAIQLCVELGIPLRSFTDYYAESSHQLHYTKLIEHGTNLAREKIQAIQGRLKEMEEMQAEIRRCELLEAGGGTVRCLLSARSYWLAPYTHPKSEMEENAVFRQQIQEIVRCGLKFGYDIGRLLLCRENEKTMFFCIDVEVPEDRRGVFPQVLHLPAGEYLCRTAKKPCVEAAERLFPAPESKIRSRVFVEVELFTGDYNCISPGYELRCLDLVQT